MPEYVLEKFACANPKTPVVVIPAFIAFASAVTADYLTGYGLSLGPLYALVIIAVSWYCGVWWGSLFAFMSVFAQIEIGLLLGHNFPEPAYFYVSNGNKLFTYLVISFLISTVRTLYERANSTARVDYLTGLTNLMGFHERLSIELARHRREGGMFAVAYIDCDHFKVINDGLGYREGDRVLQTVGRVLKSSVRETDIVARLWGDEFALVYSQTGEFEVLQSIGKLRQELDSAMTKHDWPVTFCIGVSIYPSVPEDVDRVIAFSDKLIRRVKALGKNQAIHRVYDPDEPDTNPRAQMKVV